MNIKDLVQIGGTSFYNRSGEKSKMYPFDQADTLVMRSVYSVDKEGKKVGDRPCHDGRATQEQVSQNPGLRTRYACSTENYYFLNEAGQLNVLTTRKGNNVYDHSGIIENIRVENNMVTFSMSKESESVFGGKTKSTNYYWLTPPRMSQGLPEEIKAVKKFAWESALARLTAMVGGKQTAKAPAKKEASAPATEPVASCEVEFEEVPS